MSEAVPNGICLASIKLSWIRSVRGFQLVMLYPGDSEILNKLCGPGYK